MKGGALTVEKMASRNIAIREDVYRKLLEGKKGDESFSDAIVRLLDQFFH